VPPTIDERLSPAFSGPSCSAPPSVAACPCPSSSLGRNSRPVCDVDHYQMSAADVFTGGKRHPPGPPVVQLFNASRDKRATVPFTVSPSPRHARCQELHPSPSVLADFFSISTRFRLVSLLFSPSPQNFHSICNRPLKNLFLLQFHPASIGSWTQLGLTRASCK